MRLADEAVPSPRGGALAGMLLAAGGAAAIVLGIVPPENGGLSPVRIAYELAWWALAAATLLWALRIQAQSPATLGLRRPTWPAAGWALAFAGGAILLFGLCEFWLFPRLGLTDSRAHVAAIRAEPIWLTLLIALRAGVVEEWIFRFFAIDQLTRIIGGTWLPAIAAGLLFIALHAKDWQPAHLLPVALVTILFTALYWRRHDLFTNAAAHFLTDCVPALLALLAAARHG